MPNVVGCEPRDPDDGAEPPRHSERQYPLPPSRWASDPPHGDEHPRPRGGLQPGAAGRASPARGLVHPPNQGGRSQARSKAIRQGRDEQLPDPQRASARPARGTGGPPSQGRQPVRHTGETFVRPGRATTTSGRTSQGTGHPPYGGKTSDKPGERPPDPRASIQARVWAITGWAAGPPDFGPKASCQCWGAIRRDGGGAGAIHVWRNPGAVVW